MSYSHQPPQLNSLWTFFLSRFRVTLLLVGLFFCAGWLAFKAMPQENTPDIEIPVVIVNTVWPGANAEDVTSLVTQELEAELKGLQALDEMTSTSQVSVSSIALEFQVDTDMDQNVNRVKEAVNKALPKLPQSLPADPQVLQANISSLPILTLAVTGDLSYQHLKRVGETLSSQIETVDGVRDVTLSGLPEETYQLFLDPLALENASLTFEQVVRTLQANHWDQPLGVLDINGRELEVRLSGKFTSVAELMALPVITRGGKTTRLQDLGQVRRGFKPLVVEKILLMPAGSAQRQISLNVLKAETKTNIPKTVASILELVAEFEVRDDLPPNLEINVLFSSAEDIKKSLSNLLSSGGQTLLVIVVILFLALGWREAMLAVLAIPLTLLMAILALFLAGETFNFLSLFALVLALGLLVDNAIIITEGISEGIHSKKQSPLQAALSTLEHFRWPIITGTVTTMVAFAPMIFIISGVSGQFVEVIPKTVILVLSASLIVSLFWLPVLGVLFFRVIPPTGERSWSLLGLVLDRYERFMNWLLARRRSLYLVLGGSFLTMFFAFYLAISGKIPVEVFPRGDENYFTVSLKSPSGTTLGENRRHVEAIERALAPWLNAEPSPIKNIEISLGELSPYDPNAEKRRGGTSTGEYLMGLTVNLVNKNDRELSSKVLSREIESALVERLPKTLEVKLSEVQGGPPGGDRPITLRVVSRDFERARDISNFLQKELTKIELESGATLKSVADDLPDTTPQMTWKFDREKLSFYGLSPQSLSLTLQSALQGVEVIDLTESGEELTVEARLDFAGKRTWTSPESAQSLKDLVIQAPSGQRLRLEEIADFKLVGAYGEFKRRDTEPVITVGADIEGRATASQFSPQLKDLIARAPLGSGDQIKLGGDNEESSKLIKEMGIAMGLAVFLILLVLVLQFDSFTQSVVVVSLLPLSLTGVFIGFWLSSTPIGFPTMIGILALAGIIVNDAIVLIDQINRQNSRKNLKHGLVAQAAGFIAAGKSRMQPIILTSLTTVLGLLPLALSDPVWRGLGFAIIYGMTLATFLTVVLVPCLLIAYQDLLRSIGRFFNWLVSLVSGGVKKLRR